MLWSGLSAEFLVSLCTDLLLLKSKNVTQNDNKPTEVPCLGFARPLKQSFLSLHAFVACKQFTWPLPPPPSIDVSAHRLSVSFFSRNNSPKPFSVYLTKVNFPDCHCFINTIWSFQCSVDCAIRCHICTVNGILQRKLRTICWGSEFSTWLHLVFFSTFSNAHLPTDCGIPVLWLATQIKDGFWKKFILGSKCQGPSTTIHSVSQTWGLWGGR